MMLSNGTIIGKWLINITSRIQQSKHLKKIVT
ncbi:hypothetical protein SAMN06265348_102276 [Pedobacter westerhofensis]|uniref:Uncharacterized protein n=1 Tax=Pedobacter westerhofensis TaxID=425512 RepID=A0A521BG11_9SPHI|nr:hypothetical protein SAMN06265348_102276 [Pedobacter westerhofensis]